MTDIIETRINGTPFSATSCDFKIALAPFVGILAFNYSEKRERKLVHGARRNGTPLGMTSGKYSVDACSFTMLRSSFQRLIEILTPLGLGSYGDASFPCVCTYAEPQAALAGVPPVVVGIEGCRITGVKDSNAEGIDEATTEVECMAMAMTRNGLRLWSVVAGLGQ